MYPNQRAPTSPFLSPTSPPHPSHYLPPNIPSHLTAQQYNPSAPPHPANHYNPVESEISHCAHEILNLTRSIISSGHHELRFAVFPLFMAGYVLPPSERALALGLMERMERESIGRNTRATRELLEDVYKRVDAGEGGGQGNSGVDWVRVLGERGLQLI